MAEALASRAEAGVRAPDTGDLRTDLTEFLTDTFATASEPANARMLCRLMAGAQHDRHLASAVTDFTDARRRALRSILDRAQARDEIPAHTDLTTLVDLVYGFFWYRLPLDHAPLDRQAAVEVTTSLLAAATGHPNR